MEHLPHRPVLVVLNACDTDAIARSLVQHVDCVIGMREPIRDDAAIAFAVSFYQAIALQQPVETAFRLAQAELVQREIPAAQTPTLRVKRGVDAKTLVIASRA
jgi:hypothetical protein